MKLCENRLIKAVREVGGWLGSCGVPLFSCRYSKRVFTQHQHVKCLVLKTVFRLRYRELRELLEVSPVLAGEIGLQRIPHYTTLQKFAARFPCHMLEQLITSIAKKMCNGTLNLAIDSTGFSLDTSSYHYSSRIGRLERHRDYVKTTLAVDTKTQVVAAVKLRLNRRHDTVDAQPTLNKARKAGRIHSVVADRGYDSEGLMQYITHKLHARPVIALKYKDKPVRKTHGRIRRQLKADFLQEEYRQRTKSETTNSTIKRRYDHAIRARINHTQKTETLLKVLAHNLTLTKIVETLKDFYRAPSFIFHLRASKSYLILINKLL